jgi:2,3-bisphosphoglycerate-independent phosphoglycerate mutase
MIRYSPKLDVRVAFPPAGAVDETLSETIARAGLRQVKIAESEKAVHVSFFLNGKHADPFPGEDRQVIPSPKDVAHYDACPEMAARDVADAAVRVLRAGKHDFLFVNFANVDVVGHIENRQAILKAVATVDAEAGRVVDAAREAGVTVLITADHGTVEKWYYPEGTVDTGHTNSPVPFILIDRAVEGRKDNLVRKGGALTDVAPTVLELMGLEKLAAMTGRSLLAAGLLPARRRVLVILLDGWGVGDGGKGDLIHAARTPRMDEFLARYPSTVLAASGTAVGMPDGTVGNSECGHLHLGAGRVIPTDRVRIEQAIQDGSFRANEAFRWAMEGAKRDGTRLHLVGIISFYSSHGSVEHLLELVRMAHDIGVREVYIHGMLGRRGERPESGAVYTETVEQECARLGTGRFVTIIGRFWSLDREENWDRIEKTYRALVEGRGEAFRAVN